MAPKKASKAAASYSQSESQDASQDSGFCEMAQTFREKIKAKTFERRQAKSMSLKTAHDDRVRKLRADLQTCLDDYDTQLRALRRPNVERLTKLAQQERELESRVDKCQAELAKSFEEAAQQLQASVTGRVEDLST